MNRFIPLKEAVAFAAASILLSFAPAVAQDDAAAPAADNAAETVEGVSSAPKQLKVFFPLVRCEKATGAVQVLKPQSSGWETVEVGRFYPLGSTFRAGADASAEIKFGPESQMTLFAGAEVGTRTIEIGDAQRSVVLKAGRVDISLPLTMAEGSFSVAAPFFTCSNMAGESRFEYVATGDGDETVVRCLTGTMALAGRHYKVARMRAADQMRIRTTGDDLFTSLRGESGDFPVVLDQGMIMQKDFETGETKDVPKTLNFSLSPKCAIKIFRAKGVGGKMAVSMMTFDASGTMKNRCAFTEGRSNVNSGELVVDTRAAEAADRKAKADEAEAAETESVDTSAAATDDEKKPAAGESDI